MPRQRHVTKTMTLQRFGGAKDLFKQFFFLEGCFSICFFAGTKIIFKPIKIDILRAVKPI